jgi:hypothetical protein
MGCPVFGSRSSPWRGTSCHTRGSSGQTEADAGAEVAVGVSIFRTACVAVAVEEAGGGGVEVGRAVSEGPAGHP